MTFRARGDPNSIAISFFRAVRFESAKTEISTGHVTPASTSPLLLSAVSPINNPPPSPVTRFPSTWPVLPLSAVHNTDMSEQLLTETAITSNTATTDSAGDPSPGECPKPPAAFREMFFPLSFYAAPAPVPAPGALRVHLPTSTCATSHDPPTAYDTAIARVQLLHAFLTPSMRCTLTSMLSVINMHLPPPEGLATHSLIARVASAEQTPDHRIKDIVDIIEKGLLIFAALGGGSVKKSESDVSTSGPRKRQKQDTKSNPIKSTQRSLKIRTDCKTRDPNCQICNSDNSGEVAHIIPCSVKNGKAIDFWKFVELFRGVEATAALKAVALAPNPEIVDNLKNVWFLCKICHDNFDRAKLAIIPNLDDLTYPYDPQVTISVSSSEIMLSLPSTNSLRSTKQRSSFRAGKNLSPSRVGHTVPMVNLNVPSSCVPAVLFP